MAYQRGELPCPNQGCGGWLLVEVIREEPWDDEGEQRVLDQDGCRCDREQIVEDHDLHAELQEHSDPDNQRRYEDFDAEDIDPERDLPF